jgi:hypothetical protein
MKLFSRIIVCGLATTSGIYRGITTPEVDHWKGRPPLKIENSLNELLTALDSRN